MMYGMKLLYFLTLIFGIRASNFDYFDLQSFDLESLLESEKISLPNYEKIEDLLTLFQPQNLEISNFSGTLHSDYQIGDIVRLKEYPQLTFLIQEFNDDKSGYVVADEGGLKQYFVNANHLEKCPKSQIDEYKQVRSTNFPIVGKRFIFGDTLYDITNISIENREVWIEDVISGDSYHYLFDEQDNAILLDTLPLKHVNKKIALQTQGSIDHSPIPTPTSTEPTYREVVAVASHEQKNETLWRNFGQNQLVLDVWSNKIYIVRKIHTGMCYIVSIKNSQQHRTIDCNNLRAVTGVPKEFKDWSRTGTVLLDLRMNAIPGDAVKESEKTPEMLGSFILVSFSAPRNGHCLLTDESGANFYVIRCKNLFPVTLRYRV